MTIIDHFQHFTGDYKNFAYFCKFDRDKRKVGREVLYLSNAEPVEEYDDVERFFRVLIPDMRRKSAGTGHEGKLDGVPVLISYDFVKTLFPDLDVMKSTWPVASAIVPEKVVHGTCTRPEITATGHRNFNPDYADNDLAGRIEEVRARVYNGEALQVVISRRFDVEVPDPLELLRYFMESDQSLYLYYYRFGEFEVVGSSPENLVSLDGRSLEVYPIAGTRPRGSNADEDLRISSALMNDEKELMEHRMLVDLARNDLGKIAIPGSIKVEKSMEIQKFASVMHLVSRVTGILEPEKDALDVIRAVFPAGTVSGAPKKRAVQIINETEAYSRGGYAGAIGILGNDGMDLALLIRSIFGENGKFYLQAGAGIVKDSVGSNEVNEIFSKAETVLGGLRNECASN